MMAAMVTDGGILAKEMLLAIPDGSTAIYLSRAVPTSTAAFLTHELVMFGTTLMHHKYTELQYTVSLSREETYQVDDLNNSH